MELDETKSEEHEGIYQVKQGQEYSPVTTNRRTNQPQDRINFRSTKLRKVEDL
jgi:hypothetical protein